MRDNRLTSIPSSELRRVSLATVAIAAVVGLFYLVLQLNNVVFLLFVAIVISTAIKPAVDWMHRRGLPRPVGIILVFLLIVALVAALVALVVPLVADQVARITEALPQAYRDIRERMLTMPSRRAIWSLAMELPPELPLLGQQPAETSDQETVVAVNQVLQAGNVALRSLLVAIVVLLLSFYWTLEGPRIKQAILVVLPMERREDGRELMGTIEDRLGRYIVGQGVLMASIGALSLVAYLLIGLPYALLLAIIAGLMEVVPLIGPGLGAIPAAIIAFSVDPTKAVWVIVATLIIQQLENNLLVPRIMNETVGVNPLVTLLAFIALSGLFGIIGALVAVPIAAIAQLLLNRFVLEPEAMMEQEPGGRDYLSRLRYETQEYVKDVRRRVQVQADEAGEEVEEEQALVDSLEAIASELDKILAQNGGRES
jgi:predicted PurR-regulated permease PerM